jgi:hypothetical protein
MTKKTENGQFEFFGPINYSAHLIFSPNRFGPKNFSQKPHYHFDRKVLESSYGLFLFLFFQLIFMLLVSLNIPESDRKDLLS